MGEPAVLYVTPGPEQSLWIYTESELEKTAARLDQAPGNDTEARMFRRLYFGQTESVDVDKAGRILIPERLAAFAALGKEVVLLGVRDHLELWDAQRWQTYFDGQRAKFDDAFAK
jgi:MraZ protein